MVDKPDVSRRSFLLGRFRKNDPGAVSGEPVPGPGGLRGRQRELPAELLALNTEVTLPDPPKIYDIPLDDAGIEALWNAIEIETTHLEVNRKAAPMQAAQTAQADLRQAKRAVQRGQQVQLRYRHGGVAWSDTLRTTTEGVLLTRCRLPQDPTA
jgi:hypothetical protein